VVHGTPIRIIGRVESAAGEKVTPDLDCARPNG
jgi:hypothetical protein